MKYKFKEILKQAIDYNNECWIKFIADHPDIPLTYDAAMMAKEFRTVHLGTGRRAGKTIAIQSLADSNSLVIVHRSPMISMYEAMQPKRDYSICTAENSKSIKRNDLTRIYIDEPALLKRSDIDDIYHRFARPDENVLFVLVGA